MLQRAKIKPTKQGKNLEPPKHEQRPYKIKRKKAGEADIRLNNWRFQKDRLLHLNTFSYNRWQLLRQVQRDYATSFIHGKLRD